jgi:multidrug efflux pump subunit AcrB
MRQIIAYFVRYPIWTNVLMLSVFGFGLISLYNIKYTSFPETEPDIISVQVIYPGASPEEVEEGVVLKIEETLDGQEGVARVTSSSRENSGTVSVEVALGYQREKVLTDVRNSVDRINSFPVGAEKPVVYEQKFRSRAVSVVLYGETDLFNMKVIAENLRDKLMATEEISQVAIEGLPNLEISIEVSEANLRRYQLTIEEISSAVRRGNINISGGKFETRDEEILIRAYGRDYFARELRDIVVRGSQDGTVIFLSDVATIEEQWEDVPDKRFYNDRTALVLNVDKTTQEDILAVTDRTLKIVEDFNADNSQIQAEVIDNATIGLRQRIELLLNNGLIGLVLVVATLGFFMNMRLSFWVSIGIPFSFAGMFIVAGLTGLTVNVISTFGMVIVIGILVDDAIVVGENIYAHYERGVPPLKAAVDGTMEMIAPVVTSVTTTIVAFTPFFFLDGFLGKFIWNMALVVVAALAFSLIEAFFVLPAHLAHSKGLHPHTEDRPVRKYIEGFIHYITHRLYGPVLRLSLRNKWATVVAPIALFMITIGMIGGGLIGFTFFPFIDGDQVPINVSLVSGRQEDDTNRVLERIEEASWIVNGQLKSERADGRDVILGIKRDIGRNDLGDQGSHAGKVTLLLLDGEQRDMDTYLIANRVREVVGVVPEARNINYGSQTFFGKPVSISLLGNDQEQLEKARNLLVAELKDFTALKDITEASQEGRREIDISLKPGAYALGLTLQDIAGQVRQGFFGQEVQRIQRGRDEIRVWVRYSEADRGALGFLDQMRIRTPAGAEYPFTELATYNIERGITAINRLQGQREIKVEANLGDISADLPPILASIREEVMPRVLSKVIGVQVSYEGQSRDQNKTNNSMAKTFPIALIIMVILIVLVFRSYLQAFLIISLIPFGFMGAIWGHGIVGIQVNLLSIYGLLALTGIIVNDSIVLVHKINLNLRNGLQVMEAVYEAGISRLRPILLTTITTAVGLGPVILETSRQAQFLIPMAVSVAYGLFFGTAIILLVLPAGFLAINQLRVWVSSLFKREHVAPEMVEPAVKELDSAAAI